MDGCSMNNVIDQAQGKNWALYNSDCVLFAQNIPDNSIDFAVYSPPYSSLYVYSESIADMGNVDSDEEFIEQYRYMVREKYRILRPGRVSAVHVKDLVYYQNSSADGSSGLRPFSDMVTRLHLEEGFTFHCRVTIFRDPVLERSKTNAHGLLWKTFQGDASFCRVGMPEYLLIFRKWAKPGEEDLVREVVHPKSEIPLRAWQELASPVWPAFEVSPHVWNFEPEQSGKGDNDLKATDVLNVKAARDEKAEKHLCPMPLNITKRAITLWTNEGDTVLSPFAGVGSEGVAALELGRRYIGTELHPAYFNQAVRNLTATDDTPKTVDMFDEAFA
jgi:DNA modification methylase